MIPALAISKLKGVVVAVVAVAAVVVVEPFDSALL